MKSKYGEKKGKEVFYASINAKKKGSSKWHRKSNTKYDGNAVALAKSMT